MEGASGCEPSAQVRCSKVRVLFAFADDTSATPMLPLTPQAIASLVIDPDSMGSTVCDGLLFIRMETLSPWLMPST